MVDKRFDHVKLANYEEVYEEKQRLNREDSAFGSIVGIVYGQCGWLYCEHNNGEFYVFNGDWEFTMPTLSQYNFTDIEIVTTWGDQFLGSVVIPNMEYYADYNEACHIIETAYLQQKGEEDGR